MLMRWLMESTQEWGWRGTGYWRSDTGDQKVETLIPPTPDLLGGERDLRLSSVPNGQWFHHLSLCNEASIKTQKDRVPGWWTHGYCGKRGVQHIIDALAIPHIPCPMYLFHLAIPSCMLCKKPVIWWVNGFPEFCEHCSKLTATVKGMVGMPKAHLPEHQYWIKSQRESFGWSRKAQVYCFDRQKGSQCLKKKKKMVCLPLLPPQKRWWEVLE